MTIDFNAPKYVSLQQRIGYEFSNKSLLQQALSHRSVGANNNERLEFIGDSILNCTVAQALYHSLPKENEGVLSRLRADLVCEATLAEIARDWDLGACLILGQGEIKSGGASKPSILSDAVEAIIGAIYIEAGMEKAQECVDSWYQKRVANVNTGQRNKDAKTRLQEFVQKSQTKLPVYTVLEVSGADHAQNFRVSCTIPSMLEEATGTGTSRRKAEQAAAEAALAKLGRR